MVRLATVVKSLWDGRCTVIVCRNETDKVTGRTKAKKINLYTDEPCRISFDTVQTTEPSSNAAKTKQAITLFIDPAVIIPAGSKITVTQKGVTGVYERSGKPAVYTAHQEVPLVAVEEWA